MKTTRETAKTMLQAADQFDYAAAVIWKSMLVRFESAPTGPGVFSAPGFAAHIMNAALAIEIYLKCLQVVTTGTFDKSHSLVKLFGNLPQATQHEVRQHFHKIADHELNQAAASTIGADITFDGILAAADTAFVTWRYYFEPGGRPGPWLAGELAPALRLAIIALVPEWQSVPHPHLKVLPGMCSYTTDDPRFVVGG